MYITDVVLVAYVCGPSGLAEDVTDLVGGQIVDKCVDYARHGLPETKGKKGEGI